MTKNENYTMVFVKIDNALNIERHDMDAFQDNPHEVAKLLRMLRKREWCAFDWESCDIYQDETDLNDWDDDALRDMFDGDRKEMAEFAARFAENIGITARGFSRWIMSRWAYYVPCTVVELENLITSKP